MKITSSFFHLLFMLTFVNSQAQYSLSITIPTPEEEGIVLLGLYNGPDGYLEESGMVKHCHTKVESKTVICQWDDLPAGNYSAAVLVDKNGNEDMDFTWIGWPKEAYGFYPDPGFLMRKPKWEECNFELKSDLEVVMRMR